MDRQVPNIVSDTCATGGVFWMTKASMMVRPVSMYKIATSDALAFRPL